MSSRNDKPIGIEALTKVAELDAAEKAVMNANIETAQSAASAALEAATAVDAKATEALSKATEAKTTADGVDAKATEALSTANTASENASTALETATAIDAKATEALSTANTASENASTALSTANVVDAKATEALSTANTAKTTADGIDAKATEALSTANAASTTANAASTTAGTALTTANAAASTAANVSAVATEAKSLAQSANTTSNTALQAATAANTAISTINGNDTGMSMRQVAEAVSAGLIKPKGSVAFANLPLLETTALGDMYEVTDAFVTTADFKNGAGVSCDPGTEIYVVDVNGNKMWDLLGLKIDLSAYQKKQLTTEIGNIDTVEGALRRVNIFDKNVQPMQFTSTTMSNSNNGAITFDWNGASRVVVAASAGIYYSDDGINFTASNITTDAINKPVAVEIGDSIRLVTTYKNNHNPTVIYSDDGGETWSSSDITPSMSGKFSPIVKFNANNKVYLATVNGNMFYLTSSDDTQQFGKDWDATSIDSDSNNHTFGMPYVFEYNGNVRIIVAGESYDNILYTDNLGVSWTKTNSYSANMGQHCASIVYNGTTYLYDLSRRSTDGGATWTTVSALSNTNKVIVDGSRIIFTGNYGILYSDDGGITLQSTSITTYVTAICKVGDIIFATISSGSELYYSYDGVDWYLSGTSSLVVDGSIIGNIITLYTSGGITYCNLLESMPDAELLIKNKTLVEQISILNSSISKKADAVNTGYIDTMSGILFGAFHQVTEAMYEGPVAFIYNTDVNKARNYYLYLRVPSYVSSSSKEDVFTPINMHIKYSQNGTKRSISYEGTIYSLGVKYKLTLTHKRVSNPSDPYAYYGNVIVVIEITNYNADTKQTFKLVIPDNVTSAGVTESKWIEDLLTGTRSDYGTHVLAWLDDVSLFWSYTAVGFDICKLS